VYQTTIISKQDYLVHFNVCTKKLHIALQTDWLLNLETKPDNF